MIRIENWVASIPEEDKHVAYMGEGMSETRTFFLTGEGWEQYRDWSFHLDMAFDLSTVTVRDSRQVVQTTTDSTQDSTKDVTGQTTGQTSEQNSSQSSGTVTEENTTQTSRQVTAHTDEQGTDAEKTTDTTETTTDSGEESRTGTTTDTASGSSSGTSEQSTEQSTEGQVKIKTTVTRETFTTVTEQVNWDGTTDIATLDKTVEADGIRLVWTILRQQTQLPGKLRATLRAMGNGFAQVKKSAMMIFEVEPAVIAYAAVELPVSEFEQMEARMDALCEQARQHAADAKQAAEEVNALVIADKVELDNLNPVSSHAVAEELAVVNSAVSMLYSHIGNIDTALDNIIAIQESLLPPVPITFTIADTEYQALSGMTWLEWVNSEYNIKNGNKVFVCSGENEYVRPVGNPQLAVRTNQHILTLGFHDIMSDFKYTVDYVGA